MFNTFSVLLFVSGFEFVKQTEIVGDQPIFPTRYLIDHNEASPQRNDPVCQVCRLVANHDSLSNSTLSEEMQLSSSPTNERFVWTVSITDSHFGISHSLPVWKITSEANNVSFDTNISPIEALDSRPLVREHKQHPKLPLCLKSERNSSMSICPLLSRCVQTSTGIVCLKARPRKSRHPRRGRPLPSSDSPTTSSSVTDVTYLTHIQQQHLQTMCLSKSVYDFVYLDVKVPEQRVMIKWPAVSSGRYLKFEPNSLLPEARSTYFQSGSWNQYQFVLDFRSVIDPKTYNPHVMIRLSYHYQGVKYHLAVTGNEKCCEEVSYSVRFILASTDISKKVIDVKDTLFWFYVEWPGRALRSVAFPRHYLSLEKDHTLVVRNTFNKPPLDANFRLDIFFNNEGRGQDDSGKGEL